MFYSRGVIFGLIFVLALNVFERLPRATFMGHPPSRNYGTHWAVIPGRQRAAIGGRPLGILYGLNSGPTSGKSYENPRAAIDGSPESLTDYR